MTSLVDMYNSYSKFLDEHLDRRSRHWPLMSSPVPLLVMLYCFNYFVTSLGPKIMKNRQPFDLRNAMIVYNALQVITNAWMVYLGMTEVWLVGRYSMRCQTVDTSDAPLATLTCRMVYIYFLMKLSDLTDTVFMILRKKHNQISFLHQYHHIGMCLAAWIAAAFLPGGSHVLFFGTINCTVHSLMYGYYLLTIVKPEFRQSPLKRRITELQLAQFVVTTIHCIAGILEPGCKFPIWALALFVPQDIFMFALFWDFYVKTYLKPKAKTNVKHSDNSSLNGENKKSI